MKHYYEEGLMIFKLEGKVHKKILLYNANFQNHIKVRHPEMDLNKIESILKTLSDDEFYGTILRAKGMVENAEGGWIYFDMVPEETEIREGSPEYTGRLCVIGSKLKEDKLAELFKLA